MLTKPIEKLIPPLVWIRIVQNIINVLRKTSVFDMRKLIHLHDKAISDPNGTMDELLTILKDSKKRIVLSQERKNKNGF